MNARTGQTGAWFLVVGATAALTHLGVFALSRDRMLAELANALGFIVAFFVSFFGHRHLSFQDTGTTVRQSLLRFAITALAGFAANEGVFTLLLRGLGLDSLVALCIALVLAAGQTFLLSRFWAFRR